MPNDGLIISWHGAAWPQSDRNLLGGVFLLIAGSFLLFSSSLVPAERVLTDRESILFLRVGAAFLSLLACFFLIKFQTVFWACSKSIRMQGLLLGRWLLWERRMNFDQFTAIMVRRYRGNGDDDPADTVWVYLKRENASKLTVSYYREDPGSFAKEAAHVVHAIARVTGLPIDGTEQLERLK